MEQELTLGEYLRQEREMQRITIEQIASTTKIGVRTLHALEADQYHELPAKPFIRGFIIAYARCIGLNADAVLQIYEPFMNQKVSENLNQKKSHKLSFLEKQEQEHFNLRFVLLILVMLILLAGVAIYFLNPTFKFFSHPYFSQLQEKLTSKEKVSEGEK